MKEKRNSGSLIDEVRRVGDLSQSSLAKLLALREEVVQLKQQLARSIYPSGTPDPNSIAPLLSSSAKPEMIRLVFGRSTLERKPYTLTLSGPIQGYVSLSAVRAAILLVGVVDIQDRKAGGTGVSNFPVQVAEVFGKLDSREAPLSSLTESVRVALYRFEQFLFSAEGLRSQERQGEELRFSYDPKAERLRLLPDSSQAGVEVSSQDPLIAEIIDSLLTSSPLERLRKCKSLYLPPGPKGVEKLLLELHEHSFPVKTESIVLHPAVVSGPRELLLLSRPSPIVLRRYDLFVDGLSSGRVHCTEIVEESALRRMLQVRPDATSSPLPFPASKEYALQFVEHLIWRLEHFPSYQLVVTALPLPLYLMTYEIEFPEMTEFYSLCGRHSQGRSSERDFLSDVSTYIVNDRIITELLREYTIRWIIRQPDTTSDRGKVIQFLSKLLTP